MFEDIKFLEPHFFSLREFEKKLSLDMKLPVSWVFDDVIISHEKISHKIQDKNDKFILLSLVTESTSQGYDNLFLCAKNIIKSNREMEEKQNLLKTKIKELEDLFKEESLEKLRELTFFNNGKQQEITEVVGMVREGDGEGLERGDD